MRNKQRIKPHVPHFLDVLKALINFNGPIFEPIKVQPSFTFVDLYVVAKLKQFDGDYSVFADHVMFRTMVTRLHVHGSRQDPLQCHSSSNRFVFKFSFNLFPFLLAESTGEWEVKLISWLVFSFLHKHLNSLM